MILSEQDTYEAQSDLNMVCFHQEELVKRGFGGISQRLRGRMHKLGILEPESGKRGYKLVLSDYGEWLLEEAKKIE